MLAQRLKSAKSSPATFGFEYTGSVVSTTAGITHTLPNIQLGAAHANREVFILLDCNGANSITSATLGGIACSVGVFFAAPYQMAILICPIPTGIFAPLTVTFNGSISTVIAINYRVINRVDFGGGAVASVASDIIYAASPHNYRGPAIPADGWSLGLYTLVASDRILTSFSPYNLDVNMGKVRHALSYSRYGLGANTPIVSMEWTGGGLYTQFKAAAFNS